MGRKEECVIKSSAAAIEEVMSHDEFMKRVNKSLYFEHDLSEEEPGHIIDVSIPLAEYVSELFNASHRGYTLNRLSVAEASDVQTCSPATLIMALIYLDRLNAIDPGYVRRVTPHKLFIVSMMISTKYYISFDEEDFYFSDWAEYGDMTEDELKKLEIDFLYAIEWKTFISSEQFFEKLTCVEKTLALKVGLRRGWLTYTELAQMLPSFTFAKFLFNNISTIAVSYAASVITIAGALFLAGHIPRTLNPTQLATNSSDILNEANIENATTPQLMPSPVFITPQHNQTLNVEEELLKLEKQHHDEALRALRKYNEISTEYRLTLPQQLLMTKINVNQKCAKHDQQYQQQGQWFAHKEEYSDIENPDYSLKRQNVLYQTRSDDLTESACTGSVQKKSYNNSTMVALLWNYISDSITTRFTYI